MEGTKQEAPRRPVSACWDVRDSRPLVYVILRRVGAPDWTGGALPRWSSVLKGGGAPLGRFPLRRRWAAPPSTRPGCWEGGGGHHARGKIRGTRDCPRRRPHPPPWPSATRRADATPTKDYFWPEIFPAPRSSATRILSSGLTAE